MSASLKLPHVEANRLKELETTLERLTKLSANFIVLIIGSTVIAAIGLFQNSPAVIIGAMIIAPLMRPLMGISLAALTADTTLLTRSAITLAVGSAIGITISWTIGICLQSIVLTPEIIARTHPTLLDLLVAVFAGAIGAYCYTSNDLTETLAGVAMAVALVPPLSVIGIGLASQITEVWSGAALLYATNLIGITFAGSVVFFIAGYTPAKQAAKGLLVSAVVAASLVLPLAISLRELILENILSNSIAKILREKTQTFKNVHLEHVEVKRFRKPMKVLATVVGPSETISPRQVKLVQDFLQSQIDMPIEFILHIIPAEEIRAIDITSEPSQEQAPKPILDSPTMKESSDAFNLPR